MAPRSATEAPTAAIANRRARRARPIHQNQRQRPRLGVLKVLPIDELPAGHRFVAFRLRVTTGTDLEPVSRTARMVIGSFAKVSTGWILRCGVDSSSDWRASSPSTFVPNPVCSVRRRRGEIPNRAAPTRFQTTRWQLVTPEVVAQATFRQLSALMLLIVRRGRRMAKCTGHGGHSSVLGFSVPNDFRRS